MLPVPPPLEYPNPAAYSQLLELKATLESQLAILSRMASSSVDDQTQAPSVPFYSQFADISSPKWKKIGCGITSLAMIIDYYADGVSVDSLLVQGISVGAYLNNAGWTYDGLVSVARKHGLSGTWHDYRSSSASSALASIEGDLENGPVIASVHYKFDPKNPIPHLVVVNAIKDGIVYVNDPADKSGNKEISVSAFQKAWKQRYIVIRPPQTA